MSLNTSLQHAHACADQLVNAVVDAHKEAVASEPFAELMLLDIITQARAMLTKLNAMATARPADPILEHLNKLDAQDADPIQEHRLKSALVNLRGKVTEDGVYKLVEDHMASVGKSNLGLFSFAELVKDDVLNEVIHLLDTCWTDEQMEEVLSRLTV